MYVKKFLLELDWYLRLSSARISLRIFEEQTNAVYDKLTRRITIVSMRLASVNMQLFSIEN